MDTKKIGSFATINEIREKWDMEPIEEVGDLIENSVFFQAYNQKKQAEMAQQQEKMQGGNAFDEYEENNEEDEDWNPFEEYENGDNEDEEASEESSEEDTSNEEEKADSSIFVKAFESFLEKEESINKE